MSFQEDINKKTEKNIKLTNENQNPDILSSKEDINSNNLWDFSPKTNSKSMIESVLNHAKKFQNFRQSTLEKPIPKLTVLNKCKTMQMENKPPFSPVPTPLKKKSIGRASTISQFSPKSSILKHQPSCEIESPSKIVEKIYSNMKHEGQNERASLIIPEKVTFNVNPRKNRGRIISRSSLPGRKELGHTKYSHLKKRFIKEYFFPKEEDEDDAEANFKSSRFDNVIFSNLSINALASHKWRNKVAQNNAYLIKSFSPDFIDYPESPKFLEYEEFKKNFNRVEKDNKYCMCKHNFNCGHLFHRKRREFDFESPNSEFLRTVSQAQRKKKMIYGMNYNEYEDVIDLWKVDHFKGELPDIGQAYAYMKIIKNNKRNRDERDKAKKNEKEDSNSKSKSFEFSPKKTNRSGLQLVPKKDALQINLLSPSEKNMSSIFFSPSNNHTIIKKRSPRFSVRSPSIRRFTMRSPSRKTEIQLFSFIS